MNYDILEYRHLIVALGAWITPPTDPTKYTPMAEAFALTHGYIIPTCFCTAEWSKLMKKMRYEYRFVKKWDNAMKYWGFNACIDQAKYQANVFPIDRQDPSWFPSGEPLFFPYNQYTIIQARNSESIYKMVLQLCNHFLSPSVLSEARSFLIEYILADKDKDYAHDVEGIRNPYIRIPVAYKTKNYPRCERDLMRIIWYAGHHNIHFRNVRTWTGDKQAMQSALKDIASQLSVNSYLSSASITYRKFIVSLKGEQGSPISNVINQLTKHGKEWHMLLDHTEYPWLSKVQLSRQYSSIYNRQHNYTYQKVYTNMGRTWVKPIYPEPAGVWESELSKLSPFYKPAFQGRGALTVKTNLSLYQVVKNSKPELMRSPGHIYKTEQPTLVYIKGDPGLTHANVDIYIDPDEHKHIRQLYVSPGQVYILGVITDMHFTFIGEKIKEKVFNNSLTYYFAWQKISQN